jgi:hypothetical protein
MNEPGKRSGQGGGAILAGSIIAGVIGGVIAGQPSIGFLVGAGAGIVGAALVWLRDRRR